MNRLFPSQVRALDGLRGMAILLVVPHNSDVFPAIKNWLWPVALIAHAGWIGVQLFFVLSGLLITGKLLDSRGATNYYGAFFGRRMLRIFPLYYLTLLALLVVLPNVVELPASILASYQYQGWLWVFLNNWAQAWGRSVYWFPHFWSLAIEEQFYFVWPFVVAWLSGSRLAWFCALTIAVACCLRIALLASGADSGFAYLLTFSRMDALASGALVAIVLRSERAMSIVRKRRGLLSGAAVALLVAGALVTRLYDSRDSMTIAIGYTLLAATFAILVLQAVADGGSGLPRSVRSVLETPFLGSVGKYSFAMYVFHMPIALALGSGLLRHLRPLGAIYPLLYSLTIAVLSYAVAVLAYHLVEKHFLRLKHFFEPDSSAASTA